MTKSVVEGGAADQQPSPPRWKGAQSIRLVQQLNGQCIDLFCELAVDGPSREQWPSVTLNQDLWSRIDLAARKRLAEFPFVIVDMRFKDEAWWRIVGQRRTDLQSLVHAENRMPATRSECLALETLMFAWQVAREDKCVAQMVFAMVPAVADCIAVLTMQQIRAIAIESVGLLRIRWDGESRLWRELLISAIQADESALKERRRDAKLLFCGELIQRS